MAHMRNTHVEEETEKYSSHDVASDTEYQHIQDAEQITCIRNKYVEEKQQISNDGSYYETHNQLQDDEQIEQMIDMDWNKKWHIHTLLMIKWKMKYIIHCRIHDILHVHAIIITCYINVWLGFMNSDITLMMLL